MTLARLVRATAFRLLIEASSLDTMANRRTQARAERLLAIADVLEACPSGDDFDAAMAWHDRLVEALGGTPDIARKRDLLERKQRELDAIRAELAEAEMAWTGTER